MSSKNKRKRSASASSADASTTANNTRNDNANMDAKEKIVDNAGYWDGLGSSIAQYDEDVFSSFDECESSVLRDAVERHADRAAGVALDIGCGPGLYLQALASRFAHVVGFDLSPNLVTLARRRMALQGVRNVSVAVRDLSAGRSLRGAVRAKVPAALRKTAPSFAVCANVLLSPDAACRAGILATIRATLGQGGRALFVVPSVESRLYVEYLLRRWDADAAEKEGLARARMTVADSASSTTTSSASAKASAGNGNGNGTPRAKKRARTRRVGLRDVLAGLLPAGDTPTQHFLRDQLVAELGEAGFRAVAVKKVEYKFETEFADAPAWMRKAHFSRPWDWMAVAEKM